MLKLLAATLLFCQLAQTQELPDLVQGSDSKLKYQYSHEVFSLGDKAYSEDWLHLRLGDLTGSLEMRGRDQHKITLNTTVGRLLGLSEKGIVGKLLSGLQVEARSETKRADWLLLGSEFKIAKQFNLYVAGIMNDAGSQRLLFGPYFYWAPKSYSAVLFYPSSDFANDEGAVQLRNHVDFEHLWVEASGMVKAVDSKRYFGIGAKVGWQGLAVTMQNNPKFEGGNFDRTLWGIELGKNF